MDRVLIIVGDASETADTLYPYYRLHLAVWSNCRTCDKGSVGTCIQTPVPRTRLATTTHDHIELVAQSALHLATMSANADRLRALFRDLECLDFAAVANHCSEECSYEDVPYEAATAVGRDAIRAKLELGLATLERLPTTIHELLEAGDTIMVERTEVWHHPSGERATLRVAAVFKFRDGLITLWRDYWDAPTLLRQQPADWLPEIPR